jgi:MFS family permease
MPEGHVLDAVTIGALISLVMIPLMGNQSDRFGRNKIFIIGTVSVIVFAMQYFFLLSKKSILLLTIAVMIGCNLVYYHLSFRHHVFENISCRDSLYWYFHGSWVPAAIYLMLLGVMSLICVSLKKSMSEKKKIRQQKIIIKYTWLRHGGL